MKNNILLLNHVFWPDKHNTARHTSELSEELVKKRWNVDALITNRSYVNKKIKFSPLKGNWKGVNYKRIYLPPLSQKKNIPRLFTAFWIIFCWIIRCPFFKTYDAIIIGTNPPFSYLVLPFLKLFHPKTKLFLWGFDLYPEAIVVSGGPLWKALGRGVKPIAKYCYRKSDVIVDIGPCMKSIYDSYTKEVHKTTLTPWSFIEPEKIEKPDLKTRKELFGGASLALLYSGTIGNAHEFDNFLLLARELRKRNASVGFCFAGFGNGFEKLKKQVTDEDSNISFGGFVESDKDLQKRLLSPDLMLISLKEDWTGISVPSKYFGAMAAGKAVLFSGSPQSALSIWTKKYKTGFHLDKNNIEKVADLLCELEHNKEMLKEMQHNAFQIYRKKFSKKVVCDGWSDLLFKTINN